MGLLTDIYNTVAKFFRQSDEPVIGEASKAVAANRLKLVLMQDRTNLTPKVLEQMRGEMIELLSKYLEMDKELLELNFEQEGDQVALMLSIPVIRAKDEDEIAAASESCGDDEEITDEISEDSSENTVAEETPKPKKRRSKKVSTPEELEAKEEVCEEYHDNSNNEEHSDECHHEQNSDEHQEQDVVCEHHEG